MRREVAATAALAALLASCGEGENGFSKAGDLGEQERHGPLYLVIESGKWGFIDRDGKVVIKPQFDFVGLSGGFNEGLARVRIGENWGFIDRDGKVVIKPQFDSVGLFGGFDEGLAAVAVGEKWGFIDRDGKYVINSQFDSASGFREGLARVDIGGKRGYIDRDGKYVWNPQN